MDNKQNKLCNSCNPNEIVNCEKCKCWFSRSGDGNIDNIKKMYEVAHAKAFRYATTLTAHASQDQIKQVNYLTGIVHGMAMLIEELEKGELTNE